MFTGRFFTAFSFFSFFFFPSQELRKLFSNAQFKTHCQTRVTSSKFSTTLTDTRCIFDLERDTTARTAIFFCERRLNSSKTSGMYSRLKYDLKCRATQPHQQFTSPSPRQGISFPKEGFYCKPKYRAKFILFFKTNIFQLFYPLFFILSSLSPLPLGSVCHQYFVLKVIC